MPSAIVPLATTTLSTATSSVVFSGWTATYRDLMIVVDAISAGVGASYTRLQINGNAGGHNSVSIDTSGSNQWTNMNTGDAWMYGGINAPNLNQTARSTIVINILDFTVGDKHGGIFIRSSNGSSQTLVSYGYYGVSRYYDSVTINSGTGSQFASGSTFSLYGILA